MSDPGAIRATLNPCNTDQRFKAMANLTITVDDEVLLRARKRAIEQGTSVNALLRDYLESYSGRQDRASAMRQFISSAKSAKARSKSTWTREELHER